MGPVTDPVLSRLNMSKSRVLALCCAVLSFISVASAAAVNISNVVPRRDAAGAIMDMHDGNMHVGSDGTYFWYAAGYGGCPERLGPGGETGETGCAGGFKAAAPAHTIGLGR